MSATAGANFKWSIEQTEYKMDGKFVRTTYMVNDDKVKETYVFIPYSHTSSVPLTSKSPF